MTPYFQGKVKALNEIKDQMETKIKNIKARDRAKTIVSKAGRTGALKAYSDVLVIVKHKLNNIYNYGEESTNNNS